MGFAQVTLIGNLGRDPEMSYSPNGVAVTKFSLAVSTRKKVGGEYQEKTTWYNCTAFRERAELLNNSLKKGQQVFIQGSLEPRTFPRNDGTTGISLDVTIDQFQFIEKKRQSVDPNEEDGLGELEDHPF